MNNGEKMNKKDENTKILEKIILKIEHLYDKCVEATNSQLIYYNNITIFHNDKNEVCGVNELCHEFCITVDSFKKNPSKFIKSIQKFEGFENFVKMKCENIETKDLCPNITKQLNEVLENI